MVLAGVLAVAVVRAVATESAAAQAGLLRGDAGEALRQGVIGRDLCRGEPGARDLDRRRVVAQERVPGTGGLDAGTELLGGILGRLAEPDAVAALRDDLVHHRRGPLPALDLADDRGVREAEGRHQPVGLLGVPPLLVGLDRPVQILPISARDSDIVNMAALAAYDINA